MNFILWSTLSILIYSFYMIKKIYVDKTQLYGIDIAMSQWWDKSYIPIIFEFEKDIPNFENTLLKHINIWTLKDDSMLFLKINKKKYEYDKSIFNINKFLHKLDNLEVNKINELAIKSGLSSIICYTTNSFCFCFNHTFFDGYSSFSFLKDIFDNGLTDCVHKYNYTPFFTELQCIPSLKNLSSLYGKRNLDYSPDFKYSDNIDTKFIKIKYKLELFKNIKSSLLDKNIKINFNAIISAFIIFNTFNILPQSIRKLNIGIIVALNTDIDAFNNYGLIVVSLDRDNFTDFNSLILYLNNYYIKNYHLVITSYLLNNIFKQSGDFELDILLSGGPIVLNKKLTLNNIAIKDINCYNLYNSIPIYCSYISCDRYIHITFSIRSKNINIQEYTNTLTNINHLQ
jgi:hypothetical protein